MKTEHEASIEACRLLRERYIGLDHPNIAAYDDAYVKRNYLFEWDLFMTGWKLGSTLPILDKKIKPFTGDMWQFLLVNALRHLTEEQRAGLCFDLYCRSEIKELIDGKIQDVKNEKLQEEMERCKNDPEYFYKTYWEVKTDKPNS